MTDEELVGRVAGAIRAAAEKQDQYVSDADYGRVILDGSFDLEEIAREVIASAMSGFA